MSHVQAYDWCVRHESYGHILGRHLTGVCAMSQMGLMGQAYDWCVRHESYGRIWGRHMTDLHAMSNMGAYGAGMCVLEWALAWVGSCYPPSGRAPRLLFGPLMQMCARVRVCECERKLFLCMCACVLAVHTCMHTQRKEGFAWAPRRVFSKQAPAGLPKHLALVLQHVSGDVCWRCMPTMLMLNMLSVLAHPLWPPWRNHLHQQPALAHLLPKCALCVQARARQCTRRAHISHLHLVVHSHAPVQKKEDPFGFVIEELAPLPPPPPPVPTVPLVRLHEAWRAKVGRRPFALHGCVLIALCLQASECCVCVCVRACMQLCMSVLGQGGHTVCWSHHLSCCALLCTEQPCIVLH